MIKDIQHKQENEDSAITDNKPLREIEGCFYHIAAKAIENFHTALYYTRILTDNNQSIIFPPPSVVLLQLWRQVYRLVEYELMLDNNISYPEARMVVRNKLVKLVSSDLPARFLDIDYISEEAIRQLTSHWTIGDVRSTSRVNIIQNLYFLNDDFEDPGFHLDWTMTQMLIPSTSLSIKWIEIEMQNIKNNNIRRKFPKAEPIRE